MSIIIDRLPLLNRFGFMFVVVCTFIAAQTFAQESGGESPAPELPTLEEDDGVVIPDNDVKDDGSKDFDVIPEQKSKPKPKVVTEKKERVYPKTNHESPVEDEAKDVPTEEGILLIEEDPELTPAEQEAIAKAEQGAWEKELGERLLLEGNAASAAGRWREAARSYSEASQYLPGNTEVIRGLQYAYSMLDQSQLLAEYQQQLQMARDEARAMFRDAISTANDRISREDFDGARQIVAGAIARLDKDSRLFSADDYEKKRLEANALNAQIALLQETWQQQRLVTQAEERSRDQAIRQSEESRKRSQMISESMKRIRQLQYERKYLQAIDIVDEILFIDQHNEAALALRDALRQAKLYQDWARAGKEKEYGFSEGLVQNEEAMVSPTTNLSGPGDRSTSGIMTYPSEWEALTKLREGTTAGFSETYQNRAIKVAMDRRTGSTHDIADRTLADVLNEIQLASEIPGDFFIDWVTLEESESKIEESFVIKRLDMGDVTLMVFLERVLNYVNTKNEEASPSVSESLVWYDIRDGVLEISTKAALKDHTYIEVYSVTDLLFEIRDFDAPQLSTGGGTGGGG
ncbi:MAG: hypothetical protein HOC27_06530, partial [Phycisphaerae bacterium]|nr:hypothetical protein [Phycisphaerae bacterium]